MVHYAYEHGNAEGFHGRNANSLRDSLPGRFTGGNRAGNGKQDRGNENKMRQRSTVPMIASYLRDRRMATRNNANREVQSMTVIVAYLAKLENPRFNCDEFYSAVGMRPEDVTEARAIVWAKGFMHPHKNEYIPFH
jgi:hypothetical protein